MYSSTTLVNSLVRSSAMKSICGHFLSSAALVFITYFLRPTLCSGGGKERCSTKLVVRDGE